MSERAYPEFPGASYDAWKCTPPPLDDRDDEATHDCAEEVCPECDVCLFCTAGQHEFWCEEPDWLRDWSPDDCPACFAEEASP